MKHRRTISTVTLMVILIFLLSGCTPSDKITIYKTQHCGCCVAYAAALEEHGFKVETVIVEDMAPIKHKYGVPDNMESCHTAVWRGQFIEGHVPIEAVNKLLEEQPDIDGIALPNMPAGSPGMPGEKTEQFKIYAVKDGKTSEFITI